MPYTISMDKRELLIYPKAVGIKSQANALKHDIQNANIHPIPQTAAMNNMSETAKNFGAHQLSDEQYRNFDINSPPTPSKMFCCGQNQQEMKIHEEESNTYSQICQPFTLCNNQKVNNLPQNPNSPSILKSTSNLLNKHDTNNPQSVATTFQQRIPCDSQYNQKISEMSSRSNSTLPQQSTPSRQFETPHWPTNSYQQIARSQQNSLIQQYVNQQGGLTPRLLHNLSTNEEYSLNKAIEIISYLADALERDSKETSLFPNSICIKLEHHAARARNALKEIEGILGESEKPSCNVFCNPFISNNSKLNIKESDEDHGRDDNSKAIVESVKKLEDQICKLKELLN